MTTEQEYWYALECPSRKEADAITHVEAFGLVPYVPMRVEEFRPSRHAKRTETREVPIVRSLIFCSTPQAITPVAAGQITGLVRPPSLLADQERPNAINEARWSRIVSSRRNWAQSPISFIHGVNGVPTRIPQKHIMDMVKHNGDLDKILEQRRITEQLKLVNALSIFPVGQEVVLQDGPLQGFPGVVDGGLQDRLSILVHILGRRTKVETHVDHVRAA